MWHHGDIIHKSQQQNLGPLILKKSFDKSFGKQSVQCYSVLKQGGGGYILWQTQSISHDCSQIVFLSQVHVGALICFRVDFHLGINPGPIPVYHVVSICFQPLNLMFYALIMSMPSSSTSTGRNAGCAGESLHYPCQGFWEGLQESNQEGWPRTWLLQVVNQLFMPSPYLLLLHFLTMHKYSDAETLTPDCIS